MVSIHVFSFSTELLYGNSLTQSILQNLAVSFDNFEPVNNVEPFILQMSWG